jgi:hypothetical protein
VISSNPEARLATNPLGQRRLSATVAALLLTAALASCARDANPPLGTKSPEVPQTAVAATRDGKVVELSLEDGTVQKVLAETAAAGVLVTNPNDGPPYVVLDKAADTAQLLDVPTPGQDPALRAISDVSRTTSGDIYVDISGPPCSFETWRIPAGKDAHRLQGGAWPAVSPDGARIAVVSGNSERACRRNIELGSLKEPGKERTWSLGSLREPGTEAFEEPPGWIGRLAWAEDGRFLAYEVWSLDHSHLRLLDTRSRGGELEANRLGPEPSIASWLSPNYAADGRLGILCTFCPPDNDDPAEFWIVDGRDGKKIKAEPLPATRPKEVSLVDMDVSGTILLWIASDGSLWRRSNGQTPVKLGDGYTAVDA